MMLPFDPKAGLVIVPVKLVGPDGEMITRFTIDTGATESIVSTTVAMSVGYAARMKSLGVRLTTVSGESSVAEISVDRIEVLGQIRHNFRMLCLAFHGSILVDGILGLDFLRGQKLTLDFRVGVISLD